MAMVYVGGEQPLPCEDIFVFGIVALLWVVCYRITESTGPSRNVAVPLQSALPLLVTAVSSENMLVWNLNFDFYSKTQLSMSPYINTAPLPAFSRIVFCVGC